jgi:hypothetical protein
MGSLMVLLLLDQYGKNATDRVGIAKLMGQVSGPGRRAKSSP